MSQRVPLRGAMAFVLLASSLMSHSQWIAFNDHAPGTFTHSNASRLHIFASGNPSSGSLRNISSGTNLPVTLTLTTNSGVARNASTANPAAGTPLVNVFGGFVDFTGSPDGSAEVAGAAVVTYAFSGLKTNLFYRFHGSAVRGDPTYVNRWTLCEIVGVTGFTNVHSSTNILTAARVPALTVAQAAFNSGVNHTASTGDYVAWDNIRPATNGTFSVTCRQYTGTVPGGSSAGSKGYALTGIRLEEFVTAESAPAIATPLAGVSVYEGQTAVFVADATGNPIFYRWLKNGAPISGATNRTLAIYCAQFGEAGSYSFVASNQLGVAESRNATLTVIAPQLIEWGRNEYGQVNVPQNLSNVVMVALGSWHGLALQGDGRVAGWGRTNEGQISIPAAVVNPLAIAAGFQFSMALMPDRTVRCWGDNVWNQCVVPAGLSNVVMIAAAYDAALALKADGTVVAWGRNNLGQTIVPAGLENVVKIFGGGNYFVALKADRTAAAWGGYDPSGGGGSVKVPADQSDIVSIAAANLHTLALHSDGTVAAWGRNEYGQTNVPAGLSNVVAIAAGNGFSGSHSVALRSDGSVAIWGFNNNGQSTRPACLQPGASVGAGEYYTAVLNTTDATVAGPSILASPFAVGQASRLLFHRFVARNGPVTFSATGLPPGVNLNPSTGVLGGTAALPGEFPITIAASNASGVAQRAVKLIVLPNGSAPLILQQPQSIAVMGGSNVLLQALSAGATSLQWFFNDAPLSGQTNAQLFLNAVSFEQAGNYRLFAASPGGSVWSDTASLRMLSVPIFAASRLEPATQMFHFEIHRSAGYLRAVLECSTNLSDWQPVFTNDNPGPVLVFERAADTNGASHFYRALFTP